MYYEEQCKVPHDYHEDVMEVIRLHPEEWDEYRKGNLHIDKMVGIAMRALRGKSNPAMLALWLKLEKMEQNELEACPRLADEASG